MKWREWALWASSSWALLAVNLAVGFVATPVLLKTLGTKQFGWWMVLGAYGLMLSLLEGGMGGAATRYLAAEPDTELRSGIAAAVSLWTKRYATLAAICACGAALAGPFLFPRIGLAPSEIRATLLVMGLAMAVGILASGPVGALQAHERWIERNAVQVGRQLLWLAGVGIAFWLRWGVLQLAVFLLILAGLHLGVMWRVAVPYWKPGARAYLSGEIFRYASMRAVTGILDQVVSSGPTLLAGGLLGSTAAAAVGVAERLGNLARQGIFSVSQLYLPRVSRLSTRRPGALGPNLTRGFLIFLWLTTPPMTVILLSGHRFLSLWIGPELGSKVSVLLPLVLVPIWVYLSQITTLETFSGEGHPEYGLALGGIAAAIFLIAAPILALHVGTIGIVAGQAGGILLTSALLLPAISRWRYKAPNRAWARRGPPLMAFAALPSAAIALLACRPAGSMAAYLLAATAATLAGYLAGWFGYLRGEIHRWQAEEAENG